jgi:hypothetical protein
MKSKEAMSFAVLKEFCGLGHLIEQGTYYQGMLAVAFLGVMTYPSIIGVANLELAFR